MKQALALFGALLAAVAASACCVLPAILGAASLSTLGFSAALAPYRPVLMGLTLLLLGSALYFAHCPVRAACDAEGHCTKRRTAGIKRFTNARLWSVVIMTLAALSYPQIAAYRAAGGASEPAIPAPVKAPANTVVFAVGKITCADCTLGLANALQKTPGVQKARVDFKTKRATVRYDGARIRVPQLRAVIERNGFPVEGTSS